jgi:thioesterase domain-containing protein/acyl carrier protein
LLPITGYGQVTSSPLPPAVRKPGSVGIANGIEVAIAALEHGRTLSPGERGEIVIRSGTASDWHRTGDLGWLDGDGFLFLEGRVAEIINRAGEKISPQEIEEVLLAHPAVVEAVVFPIPDTHLGHRVGAAAVLRSVVSESELRDFVAQRVSMSKVPAHLLVVSEIPKSFAGKLQRLLLAEQLFKQAPEEPIDRPKSVQHELVCIWEKVLGRQPATWNENFFDLGGDSLLALALLIEIERKFELRLPLALFRRDLSIDRLARALREAHRDADSQTFPIQMVPIQTAGSKRPFFCVLPEWGDIAAYERLSRLLGSEQPFYCILAQDPGKAPGKDPRCPEEDLRVEEIAKGYVRAIRSVQPTGPYHLCGGDCISGILAFATAQQLQSEREQVGMLAMFDSPLPPASYEVRSVWRPLRIIDEYLGELLFRTPRERLFFSLDWLKEKWQAVRRGLRPRPIEEGTAPVLHEAILRYRASVFEGRITLFFVGGTTPRSYQDRRLRWSEVASDGLELYVIPGPVIAEPHVQQLARHLAKCLDRAANCYEQPRVSRQ